jgi:hypothetical protein
VIAAHGEAGQNTTSFSSLSISSEAKGKGPTGRLDFDLSCEGTPLLESRPDRGTSCRMEMKRKRRLEELRGL